MLGKSRISAWGIAPNRHLALPDILGFGVCKVQCSGFACFIAMDVEKCAAACEQMPELRPGRDGEVVSVKLVSDMIKALQIEPKLKDFVIRILHRLRQKQIWEPIPHFIPYYIYYIYIIIYTYIYIYICI